MDTPGLENRPQLNKIKAILINQKKMNSVRKDQILSIQAPKPPGARIGPDGIGCGSEESYRELILENIEYDILVQNERLDRDRLDELVELMVDTVCSRRETIRIAGGRLPSGGGQVPGS